MNKVFVIMNLAVLLAVGLDKFLARTGRWRISEASLITVGALGGGVGLWAGMLLFHHKTSKRLFVAGAVLALATSVAIFAMCHGYVL